MNMRIVGKYSENLSQVSIFINDNSWFDLVLGEAATSILTGTLLTANGHRLMAHFLCTLFGHGPQ